MAEREKARRNIREQLQSHEPIQDTPHGNVPERKTVEGVARTLRESAGMNPLRPLDREVRMVIAKGNEEISSTVTGWLDAAYLGAGLRRLFMKDPPAVTTEGTQFFEDLRTKNGVPFRPTGWSPQGSSRIYVWEGIRGLADRYFLITHEQLHQASELGGGYDVRWDEGGETRRPVRSPAWLQEGMTNLHAYQLVESHGYEPISVGYPYQTLVCLFIQHIVIDRSGDEERGREIVRKAYLTGDYSTVQQYFDRYMGQGAFAELMGMPDSLGAVTWIWSGMERRLGNQLMHFGSASFLRWFDDPLAQKVMRAGGIELGSREENLLEQLRRLL